MKVIRTHKLFFLIITFILFICLPLKSEQSFSTGIADKAPLLLSGEILFYVHGTDSFTSFERAGIISKRLDKVVHSFDYSPDSISLKETKVSTNIYADSFLIMTITAKDAKMNGYENTSQLAISFAERIKNVLDKASKEYSLKNILIGVSLTLLVSIILFLLVKLLNYIFPILYTKLDNWENHERFKIKIQNFEIVSSDNAIKGLISFFKLIKIVLIFLLFYFYIPLVFNFFPWTRGFSKILFEYITSPFVAIGSAIADFIPNLIFITVALVSTYYFSLFVKAFFKAVENNSIVIPGFDTDWSEPTYKIVRFLIIAFTLVIIFPYLPGSDSPAFQGVSVFLGILISFGSSSAISNIVSGIVLTYTNAFKIGDRVKIADTVGDVVEKTLLVTRLKTIKNVNITIPNSMVINNFIINYSSTAEKHGLILNATVTIGYDIPWRKVHSVLIEAALSSENILSIPKPFVFQTSLDDFYVSYELNAYTNKPGIMAKIYSEIYQNIQDKFNEHGIEILSLHYRAVRDGNEVVMPKEYISDDYITPSFRVKKTDEDGKNIS